MRCRQPLWNYRAASGAPIRAACCTTRNVGPNAPTQPRATYANSDTSVGMVAPERLRGDLKLILVHHIPRAIRRQHQRRNTVLLQQRSELAGARDVLDRGALEPTDRGVMSVRTPRARDTLGFLEMRVEPVLELRQALLIPFRHLAVRRHEPVRLEDPHLHAGIGMLPCGHEAHVHGNTTVSDSASSAGAARPCGALAE